jgi:hypothetical protein
MLDSLAQVRRLRGRDARRSVSKHRTDSSLFRAGDHVLENRAADVGQGGDDVLALVVGEIGGLDEAGVDELAGGELVAARQAIHVEIGLAAVGQVSAAGGDGAEHRAGAG